MEVDKDGTAALVDIAFLLNRQFFFFFYFGGFGLGWEGGILKSLFYIIVYLQPELEEMVL